jgi:hypothetical protein
MRRKPDGAVVEEFFGLERPHPIFQNPQTLRVGLDVRQRNLVRTPEAFNPISVHLQRRTPTLWRSQHHHGPSRPGRNAARPALFLMSPDPLQATLKCCGHRLVHAAVLGSLDEVRIPAIPAQQIL